MPKTKKIVFPASPLRRKRDLAARKAPSLRKVIRGTLIKRYYPCGKSGCHCHQKGKGHGPYYYLVFNEGKKMRHVYIPQESRELVKGYVRNYWDLWEAILKVSALNLELLKRREL